MAVCSKPSALKVCDCLSCSIPPCGTRVLDVQIRMAPDNLTAYILWDAFPHMADAAEQEIWQR